MSRGFGVRGGCPGRGGRATSGAMSVLAYSPRRLAWLRPVAVGLAFLTLALAFCPFDLAAHDGHELVTGHCFGLLATLMTLVLLAPLSLSGWALCEGGGTGTAVAVGTPAPPPKTLFP